MDSVHFNFQNGNDKPEWLLPPSVPRKFTCCVCQKIGEAFLFHQYVGWAQDRWIVCKECAANGKHCSKCGIYQPFSAFAKARGSVNRGGVGGYCYPCKRLVNNANYQKNGKTLYQMKRERNLRFQKYGLTEDDYLNMLAKQGGVCACCGLPETRKNKNGEPVDLSIDHNHQTGEVRALLCSGCNVAFGNLKENPERIQALLRYSQLFQ